MKSHLFGHAVAFFHANAGAHQGFEPALVVYTHPSLNKVNIIHFPHDGIPKFAEGIAYWDPDSQDEKPNDNTYVTDIDYARDQAGDKPQLMHEGYDGRFAPKPGLEPAGGLDPAKPEAEKIAPAGETSEASTTGQTNPANEPLGTETTLTNPA